MLKAGKQLQCQGRQRSKPLSLLVPERKSLRDLAGAWEWSQSLLPCVHPPDQCGSAVCLNRHTRQYISIHLCMLIYIYTLASWNRNIEALLCQSMSQHTCAGTLSHFLLLKVTGLLLSGETDGKGSEKRWIGENSCSLPSTAMWMTLVMSSIVS